MSRMWQYLGVALTALGVLVSPLLAADVYWQTPAGGDFQNTANWQGGVVPGITDTALLSNFTAGAGITFSGNATNANVQILGTTVNFRPQFFVGAFNWTVTNQFLVNLDASVTRAPILINGSLFVTNTTGTAQMLIAPTGFGAFEVLGGNLTVDRLIATNTTDALATFLLGNGTVETLHGAQITRPGASALQIGTQAGNSTWTMRGGTNVFIAAAGIEAGRAAGQIASIIVTGNNTVWTNSDTVNLGFFGRALTTITNDAKAYSGSLILGVTGSGPGANELLITGANSSWTMLGAASTLYVGGSSSGGASSNLVTIANGGQLVTAVSGQTLHLGEGTSSSNNVVLVTGSGSTWNAGNNSITIGGSAPGNQLRIQNAGLVSAGSVALGANAGASNSVLALTGNNSLLSLAGALTIGSNSSSNRVTLATQTRINSIGTSYVGLSTKSNVIEISGASAIWSNQGTVAIGAGIGGDYNQLVISNGGALHATESRVGGDANGSYNQVVVTGANSLWHQSSDLTIGRLASISNSLLIADGATVRNNDGFLGRFSSSVGNRATVTGSGSTWTNAGLLYIGQQSGSNHLTVAAGGKVISGAAQLGGLTGENANFATITGSGSAWEVVGLNNLAVGTGGSSLNQLIITNGGRLNLSADLYIGGNASSHTNRVTATGAGTVVDLTSGSLRVGAGGDGNEMVLSDGAEIRSTTVTVSEPAGSDGNRLVITTGGLLEASSLWTGLSGGTGTITNNGGIYQFRTATPGIITSGGAITLNNGVIAFAGITNANVQSSQGTGALTPITFAGANTFRLNAASNTTLSSQTYTFDTGLGATNYSRLELINGQTTYRNGNITIGTGGSMLVSNTTAIISGLLTNSGSLSFYNAHATFQSDVVNRGAWLTDPTTNVFAGKFNVTSGGSITMTAGDVMIFKSNFVNQSTQNTTYDTTGGTFLFNGVSVTQTFATAALDLGPGGIFPVLPGATNVLGGSLPAFNFVLGTLQIANASTVLVTDAFSPLYGNEDGARAGLYLSSLVLGNDSLLIISSNVSVYYQGGSGLIVNNNVQLLGNAEFHNLIPEPSTLLLLMAGGLMLFRVYRRRRQPN